MRQGELAEWRRRHGCGGGVRPSCAASSVPRGGDSSCRRVALREGEGPPGRASAREMTSSHSPSTWPATTLAACSSIAVAAAAAAAVAALLSPPSSPPGGPAILAAAAAGESAGAGAAGAAAKKVPGSARACTCLCWSEVGCCRNSNTSGGSGVAPFMAPSAVAWAPPCKSWCCSSHAGRHSCCCWGLPCGLLSCCVSASVKLAASVLLHAACSVSCESCCVSASVKLAAAAAAAAAAPWSSSALATMAASAAAFAADTTSSYDTTKKRPLRCMCIFLGNPPGGSGLNSAEKLRLRQMASWSAAEAAAAAVDGVSPNERKARSSGRSTVPLLLVLLLRLLQPLLASPMLSANDTARWNPFFFLCALPARASLFCAPAPGVS